jgi:hypothetical protein
MIEPADRARTKRLDDRLARAFHGGGKARTLGACLLTLLASQPVAGQDSALVNPGAHVRYWLPERRGPEPQGEAGAAFGLFGGAIIGSFQFQRGSRNPGTYQGDIVRAYLFAVVCAGIGWLIGSRVHRYRWQAVPLVPDTGP